jgi:L-threonylcarbamoyladenylate synthase
VDLVLDGGPCEFGIESTIVDVTGEQPALLRPGHIPASAIEQTLGVRLAAPNSRAVRAPGMLAAHYAPLTPLWIIEGALLPHQLAQRGKRCAVLALHAAQPQQAAVIWIAAPQDATAYAHDLYANLRLLDAAGCAVILVEQPPQSPAWAAVNDRLGRAAAGSRLRRE